jgi:hypothetical protein
MKKQKENVHIVGKKPIKLMGKIKNWLVRLNNEKFI